MKRSTVRQIDYRHVIHITKWSIKLMKVGPGPTQPKCRLNGPFHETGTPPSRHSVPRFVGPELPPPADAVEEGKRIRSFWAAVATLLSHLCTAVNGTTKMRGGSTWEYEFFCIIRH
jgi:hypothetical protein